MSELQRLDDLGTIYQKAYTIVMHDYSVFQAEWCLYCIMFVMLHNGI